MKFDSRYSAPIRPIFRIPAILLGSGQLIFGLIFLADGGFKVGLPQTLVGLIFLIAGIKGRLPKWVDPEEREKEFVKKLAEGKISTRNECFKSLIGLIVILSIAILVFIGTEIYTFGWWVSVFIAAFSATYFYLISSVLLEIKGFHSLLALTILFPILLLIYGIIKPENYEQMGITSH